MKKLFNLIFIFVIVCLFLSFNNLSPVELQGKVVNSDSNLPLANVYLYTVEGEEEAITDKNGEFKFTTWRPTPILLTIQHGDFQKQTLKLFSETKNLTIKLKSKN